jgi:hypothetical protein
MARQEDDRLAAQPPEAERVRRLTEGRGDVAPLDIGQPVDLIKPAAADDPDYRRGMGSRRRQWRPAQILRFTA